jgi:prolyl-tRNA synthetase
MEAPEARCQEFVALKASQFFFPTLREIPAEAEIPSHQLLLRAGFVRKLGAGIYTYLPLAWRVLRKIEQILREEMDAIACLEMRMPTLHPKELLDETGRWGLDVVYKLRDRREAEWALGFTHEEVVADIIRRDVRSWRNLPLLLYQIQTKFRDEPRPRGGLVRTREFIMFDAYSFDADDAAVERSYQRMWRAYANTFRRCGLETLVVEADGGAIGDLDNHEFMTISPSGEDVVSALLRLRLRAQRRALRRYRPAAAPANANSDKARWRSSRRPEPDVDEVAGMLGHGALEPGEDAAVPGGRRPRSRRGAGRPRDQRDEAVALCRRARSWRLRRRDVERADRARSGLPDRPAERLRIVADQEVAPMRNFINGANQADAHYVHVNIGGTSFPVRYADSPYRRAGDRCPALLRQAGTLEEVRGIEVGTSSSWTKVLGAMNATFTDEAGKRKRRS